VLHESNACSRTLGRRARKLDGGTLGKNWSRSHTKTRRYYSRVVRMSARLRILSNMGLIIGQCVLLFVSREAGLCILIPSSFLSVPFFLKEKCWDVLMLIGFMQAINVIGLFVQ